MPPGSEPRQNASGREELVPLVGEEAGEADGTGVGSWAKVALGANASETNNGTMASERETNVRGRRIMLVIVS